MILTRNIIFRHKFQIKSHKHVSMTLTMSTKNVRERKWRWLTTVVLLSLCRSSCGSVMDGINALFEIQTSKLITDADEGIVAAFGDFNADEIGDIFLITNNSQVVSVLLGQKNKPYIWKPIITVDNVIAGLAPADFNGDAQMDILVITRPVSAKEGPYTGRVYWGNRSTSSVDPVPYNVSETFQDEPLMFDFNADMLPDLLVEPAGHAGVRKVWLSHTNKTMTLVDFPTGKNGDPVTPFAKPQSHAFIDLNNDLVADLLLTTQKGYEVWINVNGEFTFNGTRSYPEKLHSTRIGESSFADLDLDQKMDHMVPGCLDEACTRSAIYVYNVKTGKWLERMKPESFEMNGHRLNFVPPDQSQLEASMNQSFYIKIRMGDYNLDGYADALVVLQNTTSDPGTNSQSLFLLDNVKCEDDSCSGFNRTFQLHESKDLATINKGVVVGTFYDVFEDGIPDIVMVSMVTTQEKGKLTPKIVILENDVAADDCFIKITVVSGLCGDTCTVTSNPYGVNYPGPAVSYATMKTDGTEQKSTGTQLTQTAHFALQTPYQTFGLGPTPNFLESMTVGITQPQGTTEKLQKSWTFIIPNSQLIVIPHPPAKPSSWLLKLYVTPSQLVYVTGATLLGTCAFVAVIAGILHWREKRDDMLEKKQEAQRFHFDAM